MILLKKWCFSVLFCTATLSVCHAQSSKRKPPIEVEPLVIGQIKYTAPTDRMGFVQARDLATDSLLWTRQIYTVRRHKNSQACGWEVYIDKLYRKGSALMIHTERGKTYSIPTRS